MMQAPLLKGYLTQPYWDQHLAIDLGFVHIGITDPRVVAWRSGIVLVSIYDKIAGNKIILRHDLNPKYCLLSMYYHLKSRAVIKGQFVQSAQALGIAGNTGTSSRGAHLHFETWLIPTSILDKGLSIKDKPLYAFDPRTLMSTDTLTGEGLHMITTLSPALPTALATVQNLRYRLAPSLTGKELGKMIPYTPYPYLGHTDLIEGHAWAKMVIDDIIVYASMNYLEVTIPQIEKPVHILIQDEHVKVQVDSI